MMPRSFLLTPYNYSGTLPPSLARAPFIFIHRRGDPLAACGQVQNYVSVPRKLFTTFFRKMKRIWIFSRILYKTKSRLMLFLLGKLSVLFTVAVTPALAAMQCNGCCNPRKMVLCVHFPHSNISGAATILQFSSQRQRDKLYFYFDALCRPQNQLLFSQILQLIGWTISFLN